MGLAEGGNKRAEEAKAARMGVELKRKFPGTDMRSCHLY